MTTFKVGDRAIVTGNGGGDHVRNHIVSGTDVEIVADADDPHYVSVLGLTRFGASEERVTPQWVHPDDLELFVDTLFAVGDRAIVSDTNEGIAHFLEYGLDVTVGRFENGDYRVTGVSAGSGVVVERWVTECDLLPVPDTSSWWHEWVDGGKWLRELSHYIADKATLAAALTDIYDGGVVRSTATPTWAPTRAEALRDAVAIFAGFGDISAVGLIAVAEWLYTGRVRPFEDA